MTDGLLTAEELLACECFFLLAWDTAAQADGRVDDGERRVLDFLLNGAAAHHDFMLPMRYHTDLGSTPYLAHVVLRADKGALRDHLATVGSFAPASEIDERLEAFVRRARTPDEMSERIAYGRGLFFEAVYFGIQTARATGARFGPKISQDERSRIVQFGVDMTTLVSGSSLDVSRDDTVRVLTALELADKWKLKKH